MEWGSPWGSQQSLHRLASEEELDKERQEQESLLGKQPQLIHIEDDVTVAPIDEDAKGSTPSSQVQYMSVFFDKMLHSGMLNSSGM